MMYKHYALILGIIDTLNDWNEKLNEFASEKLDSVWVGTLILGELVVIGFWGIQALNKK